MEQSYKEKYEDILARLERAKNDNEVCDERYCCVIDDLIPELAESEDEKVRKTLIQLFQSDNEESFGEFTNEQFVAWLEKQGKKPADTVEPKFHEGEWITNDDYTWKIVEINPLDYILLSQDDNIVVDTISHVDEQFHSFTIRDAKDGDVLATSTGAFIYNGNNGGGSCPGCYCGINTLGRFQTGVEHHWTGKKVYPATKEQRDILLKAMAKAGYTFDFERKELKKIEQKPADKIEPKFKVKYAGGEYNVLEIKEIAGVTYYGIEDEPNHIDYVLPDNCEVIGGFGIKENGLSHPTKPAMFSEQKTQRMVSAEAKEAMYDKPTEWSEGDEENFRSVYLDVKSARQLTVNSLSGELKEQEQKRMDEVISWLKSLKDRVQPKQEWSEEDERMYRGLHNLIYSTPYCDSRKELSDWLKSIKDRVQPQPKYNFGDTELTQEELCEGLIRGMVDEHNRVTKEVLRNEYEKGRADAIAEMQKDWSIVDKDILFRIICDLKFLRDTISIDPKYAVNIIDMEREITWLKSLKPQNHWKPSDEQIRALKHAFTDGSITFAEMEILATLYEGLKSII